MRACGLFPLNSDAVDCTKCIMGHQGPPTSCQMQNVSLSKDAVSGESVNGETVLEIFENEVGQDTLRRFQDVKDEMAYPVEDDRVLYRFWLRLQMHHQRNALSKHTAETAAESSVNGDSLPTTQLGEASMTSAGEATETTLPA